MKLQLRYFALLRDQRGLGAEEIETGAATPAELFSELSGRHGFTLELDQLKVAVNEQFVDWSHSLKSGDTVVFVPPVAGG